MSQRARHVLVLLVVVGLAATLYFWRGLGVTPIVDMSSDVRECAANLSKTYAGLVLHSIKEKHAPSESGVRLLAVSLNAYGHVNPPANRAWFTCPGPGAKPVRADVDYRALATLTGADSAYAARDMVNFPLAKFPSGGSELEPIAACDNAHGMNHEGCMNVLYSDGSILTLFLAEEIERGRLAAGAETIPVGKDSPIPDLRELSQD